jgi:hypothetical protein
LWFDTPVTDADVDDAARLVGAFERFPSLVPCVTVEPYGRYARVALALRDGTAEAIWGDGYTRVYGELVRCEGFVAADDLADMLDVVRMLDAVDGRIGRVDLDGECLVRVSKGWTERRERWWSRQKTREPALRIEYSQVSWAPGVDSINRVEYSDTLVTEDVREEIERLEAGRWLELGKEIPVEWLSLDDSAAAAARFTD